MNVTDVLDLVRHLKANTLKYLQLSYNRIRRVPKRTFFFYVNLRHLDLGHNQISTIENLAGLSKLEYLNLAYNSLDNLDEMMFEGLHELNALDISHNALVQLSDEPFLNLFNLNVIDVSANQIQTFQISAGLESLEVLRASWNKISNLRFLQHLRRLRTLDLSHNAVSRLPGDMFSRGQTVSTANFSFNSIFEISPSAFQSVTYGTIDLSKNRLTSLAGHGMENVRVLYLQENSIYNVTASAFTSIGSLEELHLQRNNLFSLSHQPFVNLDKLTVLDLSSNPLGRYIDMADGNELTAGLERLEFLRLSDTGMTRIAPNLLTGLPYLRQLDLSQNKLHELSATMFAHSSKLTELNLAQNSFRNFDVDIFTDLTELKRFDLSKNPTDCTCELVPLCHHLFTGDIVETASVHNRTLYQCRTPDEWLGVSIAEFHADSAQCSHFVKIVIVVAVFSAILLIVATLVIAVYRYKTWKRHKIVVLNKRTINYKFVDETSLTNTSNSSGKSAVPILVPCGTPKKLPLRQWV